MRQAGRLGENEVQNKSIRSIRRDKEVTCDQEPISSSPIFPSLLRKPLYLLQ